MYDTWNKVYICLYRWILGKQKGWMCRNISRCTSKSKSSGQQFQFYCWTHSYLISAGLLYLRVRTEKIHHILLLTLCIHFQDLNGYFLNIPLVDSCTKYFVFLQKWLQHKMTQLGWHAVKSVNQSIKGWSILGLPYYWRYWNVFHLSMIRIIFDLYWWITV